MIRLFTIFCKLNEISFSDKQWLEEELNGFRPDSGAACPFCGAKGCLEKFACYDRYLIEMKGGEAVTRRVRIPRYRCGSCGHTHAALSSCLVPYRSYSLRFILHVLRCYFLHLKTVSALCETAGISPSTLYEWKEMFLRQKSLWLGVLSDLEQSAASFLDGMDGKGLEEFHGVFRCSFLQRMSCTDGEPPPKCCESGSVITEKRNGAQGHGLLC